MIIIIISIIIYIVTIFAARYMDIKVQIHKDPIHYKKHIESGIWFVPVINILMPIINYISHEVETRKMDIKHNKFINWFFIGVNYKTDHDVDAENEFNEFFNNKQNENKDLTNPFKK